MKKLSLKTRTLNYLRKNGGWINGGELERIALSVGYKASNISRRARELHEEGLLERHEVKGSVEYKYIPRETKIIKPLIVEHNGERSVQLQESIILN